jgi:hypothetical protein
LFIEGSHTTKNTASALHPGNMPLHPHEFAS